MVSSLTSEERSNVLFTPIELKYKNINSPSGPQSTSNSLCLRWKNIKLQVNQKSGEKKKIILNNVSGEVSSGKLTAIMGPSGAGKSSLLDCLSGRNNSATGMIEMNGQAVSNRVIKKQCAYVVQEDLFYESLTVHEHLYFQAQLRMGKKYSSIEKGIRVDNVIEDLGLIKCKSTCIGGNQIRGISGGERKRLSIATELLTNPSVFFLDEPTSGLDSFMAETVIKQLKQLALEGRTVLLTIHQPSSSVFNLFDNLLLLAKGEVVYHSEASKALNYFATLGLICPSYINPSEFFMQHLTTPAVNNTSKGENNVDYLLRSWKNYNIDNGNSELSFFQDSFFKLDSCQLEGDDTDSCSNEEDVHIQVDSRDDHYASVKNDALQLPKSQQLVVLYKRNIRRLIRDKTAWKARLARSIVGGLVVGLVFNQLQLSQAGIQNYQGVLFFIAVNLFYPIASTEFLSFPTELPLFKREYQSGLYNVFVWFLAKNISELPFQLIMPLIYWIPAFFLIGIYKYSTIVQFFQMALLCVLMSSCATAFGYLVSSATSRSHVAVIVGTLLLMPIILCGGLLLNYDSTPIYLIWLQYLSPLKYGFTAFMVCFWEPIDHIPCNNKGMGGICRALNGKQVLLERDMENASVTANIFALFGVNVCCRLLASIILWLRFRRK